MAFLDSTVVNVVLPTLGRSLHADLAGLQWTLDAYLLTLSAFLLVGGSLGDRLGRKRMFEVGVVDSPPRSALRAGSPAILALSLARALQGSPRAAGPAQPRLVADRLSTREIRARPSGSGPALSGVTSRRASGGRMAGGDGGWRAIVLPQPAAGGGGPLASRRCVPDTRGAGEGKPLDVAGVVTGVLAVGA
jgi:MFS family permease